MQPVMLSSVSNSGGVMVAEEVARQLIRIVLELIGAYATRDILSEEEIRWANEVADRFADQKFGDDDGSS